MPRAIPGRPSDGGAARGAGSSRCRTDAPPGSARAAKPTGVRQALPSLHGDDGPCECNVSKEVEYEVEAVLSERAIAGGCTRTAGCPKPDRHRGRCPRHRELASREYLVWRKDWPDEDATWETEDALDGAPEVLAAWRAAVLARAVEAGEATLRVEAERRPRPPLADPELRFAWPVLLAPAAVLTSARAAALARRWPTPAELEARRARRRGRRGTPPAPEKAPPVPAPAAGAGAAADARASGCRRAAHSRRQSAAAEPAAREAEARERGRLELL